MTSTCLGTTLNSPLLDWQLKEGYRVFMNGSHPRNRRVANTVKDLEAINEYFLIPSEFSMYPQPLQQLGYSVTGQLPIEESSIELECLLNSSNPIVTSKISESMWSGVSSKYDVLTKDLQKIRESTHYEQLRILYSWKWFYEKLVCLSARPENVEVSSFNHSLFEVRETEGKVRVIYAHHPSGYDFYITTNVVLIYDDASEAVWISSRNHLLMLSDSSSQRYICLLSSIMASIFSDYSIPSPAQMMDIFLWGDALITKYGNDGYKLIKLWEALITSRILVLEQDDHVDTHHFQDYIVNEFTRALGEDEEEFLVSWLNNLDEIIREDEVEGYEIGLLTQLHGMYRIWGHPSVSGLNGVIKLKEITTQRRGVNLVSVGFLSCKWREFFTQSYYNKYHHLPEMDTTELSDHSFLKAQLSKQLLPDFRNPNYNLMDWEHVKFNKTFHIPDRFDFTEMIADKATSLGLNELKEECERTGDIGSAASRSVIMRWLKSKFVTPKDFLDTISREGFPADENVCGVYPKEREEKNNPRLFGLMPLVKRLYIVLTEALLADFLLPLFPEITMTLDQVSLFTRLYHSTKNQDPERGKDREGVEIITNLDFEKWNSYMRTEETYRMFSDFDDLFGLKNVFSRSHELFNPCQFYLADGSITPKFIPGTTIMEEQEGVWQDHLGGIEGLRQKGWTIFTVVLLKYISTIHDVKCQIIGQGDNQVLIVTYYPKPGLPIKQQHLNFMETLNRVLNTIGPPLKLEESWASSLFFSYGKFPIYKGVPQPASLKKSCRTGRLNNDGMINLDATISSISANMSSAIQVSNCPIIPYYIGMMETIASIKLYLTEPFYGTDMLTPTRFKVFRVPLAGMSHKITIKINDHLYRLIERQRWLFFQILSIFPGALGGYPVPQVSDLLLRGFPDPVSAAVWELKLMLNSPVSDQLKSYIRKILSPVFNPDINPELLCQDPTGLNLLKGSRPKDKLKRSVFSFLQSYPGLENEAMIEFLQLANLPQTELSQALFSTRPCHPRVMASVYESTLVGQATKAVRKIDRTPVLLNLMINANDSQRRVLWNENDMDYRDDDRAPPRRTRLMSAIFASYETNQLNSMLNTLNQKEPDWSDDQACSTETARLWRKESWQVDLEGVTVPFPREMCGTAPKNDAGGYIHVTCVDGIENHDLMQSLGPYKPYLGSASKEKIEYLGKEIKTVAPSFLKSSISNLRLVNWGTQEHSQLYRLIIHIFRQFTDLDPRTLIPSLGTVTGTLAHRFSDMRTSHSGTLSVPYTVSTHMTVNTNNFHPQMMDHVIQYENLNIIFQALFSFISGEATMKTSLDDQIPEHVNLYISCKTCIQGIDESLIEITEANLVDQYVGSEAGTVHSDFLWVSAEHLEQELELSSREVARERLRGVMGATGLIEPRSASDHTVNLREFLTVAVLDNIFLHHHCFNDPEDSWMLEELQEVIPVAQVPKLDINLFFDDLCLFFTMRLLLDEAYKFSFRLREFSIEWKRALISFINTIPTNWFKPMTSLFVSNTVYMFVSLKYPQLGGPKGSPPSIAERALYLKKVVTTHMISLMMNNQLPPLLGILMNRDLPVSPLSIVHPQVIASIVKVLTSSSDMELSMSLGLIRKIRRYEFKIKTHTNLMDIRALSLSEKEGTEEEAAKKILSEKESNMIDPLTAFKAPILATPDWISKRLGSRIHPDQALPPLSNEHKISLEQITNLPEASTSLKANMTISPLTQSWTLPDDKLELIPNPINSLFKYPVLVTSAGYKLLSVMREIVVSKLVGTHDVNVVLSVGDGTGGFSALLASIFPNSIIHYNTLFDHTKLSSVGIDKYVPAAFVMNRVNNSRIIGIRLLEENISDITHPKYPDIIREYHETIDVITCDAEGAGDMDPSSEINQLSSLLQIARFCSTKLMIFKTYGHRSDIIIGQLLQANCCFRDLRLIRSHFSGQGNSELYLVASHPRKGSEHVDVICDDNRIKVTGNLPAGSEIRSMINRIKRAFDYYRSCEKLERPYFRVISPSPRHDYADPNLRSVLMILRMKSNHHLVVYPNLMDYLRSTYPLSRFMGESRRTNLGMPLTLSRVKEIALIYLGICFACIPNPLLEKIREYTTQSSLFVYENLSGSWAVAIRKTRPLGKNFLFITLDDLFSDTEFSKRLFSNIRDTKDWLASHQINIHACMTIQPHILTNFPIDSSSLFNSMGKSSVHLNDLPVQLPGQYIIPPRTITREFISGLTADSSEELSDSLGFGWLDPCIFQDQSDHQDLILRTEYNQRARRALVKYM